MKLQPASDGFLGLPEELCDLASAGCVIVPAPFEQTSSYGGGSKDGPAAIIEASQQVEFYDALLGFEPCALTGGIVTQEAVDAEDCDGAEFAERLRAACTHWIREGKFVVALGGEHTSIVGAVRAHVDAFEDVTVLQLDAHADLRERYEGSPWSHACAMRRVLDFHPRIMQAGIRSMAKEEAAAGTERGLPLFLAEDMIEQDRVGADWMTPIIEALSSRVYVTFDCDVLDPADMPATGTPEPGGLRWTQASRLLARVAAEREIVGFDFNELAPIPGLHHPQFAAAKLVYRLIGNVFQHRN